MKPLLISKKGLLLFLLAAPLLMISSTWLDTHQYASVASILFFTGCATGLIGWIVLLTDILQNPISHKSFWVLGLLILPPLAFIYLFKRDALIQIRIDEKRNVL